MNTYNELEEYKTFIEKHGGNQERIHQSESLFNCLNKYFLFDKVICIETGASQNKEDGCFGLYLGKIVESTSGEFYSVDINKKILTDSTIFYTEFLPNLPVTSVMEDSINYLTNFK